MTPERGINKKIAAAVLAGGIALGVGGYAATRGQEQQPVNTPTPSAAAASPTPERTPVPTATPTAEPTPEATPTKSPEASKEVECSILPKELCNLGIYIQVKNDEGTITDYIAFEDLPTGTPLFALVSGERTTAQIPPGSSSQLQGSLISTFPSDRSVNYTYIGDLKWNSNTDIKSGDPVASITNTGIKIFGRYELLITAGKRNTSTGRLEPDKEALRELFPKALEKEPIILSKDPSTGIITSPRYADSR